MNVVRTVILFAVAVCLIAATGCRGGRVPSVAFRQAPIRLTTVKPRISGTNLAVGGIQRGPNRFPVGSLGGTVRGQTEPHAVPGRWSALSGAERFAETATVKWTPKTANAITGLERSARRADWSEVVGAAQALRKDADLPGALSGPIRELEQSAGRLARLQRFHLFLHTGWERPPTNTAIDEALEQAEARGGPAARKRLADYLACRAHLEGHTGLARRLRGEAEPLNARGILRDLKNIGEVPPAETPGGANPLGLPVPEGPAINFRPDVRESLGADLPLLQELGTAERKARAETTREVERLALPDWQQTQVQLSRLTPYVRQANARPGTPAAVKLPVAEDAVLAEVAKLAGRPLSQADGLLARHLLAKKQSTDEVATILKGIGAEKGGEK